MSKAKGNPRRTDGLFRPAWTGEEPRVGCFNCGEALPPASFTELPLGAVWRQGCRHCGHEHRSAPRSTSIDPSVRDKLPESPARFVDKDGQPFTIYTPEADPNGKSPHEPGAKLDAGKAPLFRGALDYFPRALLAVAEVSAFGAQKYAWRGWETVPEGVERYTDALARHLVKERIEGLHDADSGLLHAAHAAWGALARLELMLRAANENTNGN